MNAFGYFISVIQLYVVPFIFAIALIFIFYGVIQYFLLGPGEEPVREEGRQNFIKAFVWCLAGVGLYLLFAGLAALQATFTDFSSDTVREQFEGEGTGRPGSGGTEERIQPIPNVPRR